MKKRIAIFVGVLLIELAATPTILSWANTASIEYGTPEWVLNLLRGLVLVTLFLGLVYLFWYSRSLKKKKNKGFHVRLIMEKGRHIDIGPFETPEEIKGWYEAKEVWDPKVKKVAILKN